MYASKTAARRSAVPGADVDRPVAQRLDPARSFRPSRSAQSGLLQPRLEVGSVSDPLEREADAMAERVLAQRHPGQNIQGGPLRVSRKCAKCEEDDKVQRKATQAGTTGHSPAAVHEALRSPGRALDPATRDFFELRFGHDFSHVRVHTDATAALAARSVEALAFTVGSDIVFGAGRFSTGGSDGRRLIAHELTHVLQQTGPSPAGRPTLQRQAAPSSPEVADEADVDEAQDETVTDSPVDSITIDPSSSRTRFHCRNGKVMDGRVLRLASSLEPGDYTLKTRPGVRIDPKVGAFGEWDVLKDGKPYSEGQQFDVDLAKVGRFAAIRYAPSIRLQVIGGVLPTLIDIDERIADLKAALSHMHLTAEPERQILSWLDRVPAEQAAEFVRRLRAETFNGVPLLDKLDDYVDGENNTAMHTTLSRLKIQAGGSKAAAALVEAPTLAWHDVMGFFEQKAVFSVTRASNGKVRIRYLGGVTGGLYSNPEFDEIKRMNRHDRLNIMTGEGIEVDADQPIIVHDYDSDRRVVLTAEDLITYQHRGVRKFLQDVGMIASLATPAGAETVGARVIAYGVQITSLASLIVDENQLNLKKWFPNWAPAIIETNERIKLAIAIVGVAQLVRGGWQLFSNLRRLRGARAAMDAKAVVSSAEELTAAEREAALLESRADRLLEQADLARKEMQLADQAAGNTASSAGAQGQSAPATAKPAAAAHAPAKLPEPTPTIKGSAGRTAVGDPLAQINEETAALLKQRPELKEALKGSPRAARALKLCRSPCFPDFASRTQIDRLERMLEAAEDAGIYYQPDEVTRFLRGKANWQELEQGIDELQHSLDIRQHIGEATHQAAHGGTPAIDTMPTSAQRALAGEATGGAALPEVTGQWFPEARDAARRLPIPGTKDPRVAQIPGQMAKRLRGMSFKSWDDFRETFWQMVAKDDVLNKGWTKDNLARMKQGLAPISGGQTGGGSNRVYQLNHRHALKHGGDLYDLDNIEIVQPAFHQAIGG